MRSGALNFFIISNFTETKAICSLKIIVVSYVQSNAGWAHRSLFEWSFKFFLVYFRVSFSQFISPQVKEQNAPLKWKRKCGNCKLYTANALMIKNINFLKQSFYVSIPFSRYTFRIYMVLFNPDFHVKKYLSWKLKKIPKYQS